jgi:integrase/recombinase XerD
VTRDVDLFGNEHLVLDAELVDEHQGADVAVVGHDLSPAEQLVQSWLLRCRTDNTRQAYRRDLAGWLRFLEGRGIELLDAEGDDVELYQREIESTPLPATGKPPAPATVRRRLEAVSSLYAWAVKRNVLPRNPVAYVDRPHVDPDHSDTRGLTQDEARRFVATAFGLVSRASGQDVRRVAARDSVMVATLLTTGLRVSEICSLEVGDLGYDRGFRVVKVTRKGGKRASVVLGAAAELIDRRLAEHGTRSGPLFTTRSGGPVDRAWVFRAVRRVTIAAAIPDPKSVTPHGLRHTFATLALDRGATLDDLQDALGHAAPRTTRRYDRNRNRVDRSPVHDIGRALLKGNDDRTGRLF